MSEKTRAFLSQSEETRVQQLLDVAFILLTVPESAHSYDEWEPAVEEWVENFLAHQTGQ